MVLQNFEIIIGIVIVVMVLIPVIRKAMTRGGSSKPTQKSRSSAPPPEKVNQPAPKVSSVVSNKQSDRSRAPLQIFISYRRSDSADIAGRIYDRLVDRFGRDPVFKDVDSIPLGLDFKVYLDEQVGRCDVLLAIIGDRWLDADDSKGRKRLEDPKDFVRIEIESALDKGISVIPLLVRGANMPDEESLPSSLHRLVYRNGIPIRSDPDFHRDMDRLIKSLEKNV